MDEQHINLIFGISLFLFWWTWNRSRKRKYFSVCLLHLVVCPGVQPRYHAYLEEQGIYCMENKEDKASAKPQKGCSKNVSSSWLSTCHGSQGETILDEAKQTN